jgi:DNA-binding transcriptional regulator YdaS (Cro superfamily)
MLKGKGFHMRIEKYLEAVMDSKHIRKDKDLAEWLGVTPSAISQYRSGARTMSNEQCVAIALELGIDPLKVIMATDLDKAERAGQKSLWEVFSQRTATNTASVALALGIGVVTLFVTPTPSQAAPMLKQDASTICIMLNRRRKKYCALAAIRTRLSWLLFGPTLQSATS